MCSRPPRLSNQSTRRGALRARPAIARPARPADCLDARAQRAARREPGCWSGASLEVFVPCNARWRRSRCPGRPASGRSRFGVSSRRRPARPHFHADLPARMTLLAPVRFSAQADSLAMKLAWRTCFRRSVPTESVARTIGTCAGKPTRLPGAAAGRRSVAPTRTSSIARADETGETDPQRHPPAGTLAAGARHAVTLARDPYHSSAFARTPPPDTGHSPNAPSSRGVPLPVRAQRCLAGRRRSSLSSSPDGAHGVQHGPSQVCSRCRVDTPRLLHVAGSRTPLCVRSTFLPVRAHVPFVPPRPPRLIFVGVTDRLLEVTRSAKAIGRGQDGIDFWASRSRLRSVSPALVGPGKRSCLGLCLLQGCRTHCRASPAGSTPLPITNLRTRSTANTFAASVPYPLMGLRRSFPSRTTRRELPRRADLS
jgi:hypothetical protein